MNNNMSSGDRGISRRSLLRNGVRAAIGVAAFRGLNIHVRSEDATKPWLTGNEAIDKPRSLALELLKPTRAQIEHAWELHFGSLVFESYGFAPRCAVDGARVQEAVMDGASADE